MLDGANSTKFLTCWISAEYPCQVSKYFFLAKYSDHFEFLAKIAKHKNACILKTVLDRADCADFGCHNSIRLETEHFLNTLALTFISFSGRFVFAIIFFFASDPLVLLDVETLPGRSDKDSEEGEISDSETQE